MAIRIEGVTQDSEDSVKTLGDCYRLAGRYVLKEANDSALPVFLCHGIVTGRGPLRGRRFGHAWVEAGNVLALDLTTKPKPTVIPRSRYYTLGHIKGRDVRRYTADDARVLMLRHKHWGPWE